MVRLRLGLLRPKGPLTQPTGSESILSVEFDAQQI